MGKSNFVEKIFYYVRNTVITFYLPCVKNVELRLILNSILGPICYGFPCTVVLSFASVIAVYVVRRFPRSLVWEHGAVWHSKIVIVTISLKKKCTFLHFCFHSSSCFFACISSYLLISFDL